MKKTVFLLGAIISGSISFAQKKDSVLKDQTIEVIQSYKPVVKQAPKPAFSADMPPRDTTHPVLQYDVPQQALYYSYTAMPIRPLALGKDSASIPYPNYIKLGGGNLSTLYVDAGIGSISGKNYKSTIHLHHLQQQGLIKYQKTAFSGLEANGSLLSKTMQYNGAFEVLRNQYGLYGGFVDTGTDAPKNIYYGVSLAMDAKNEIENNLGINYNPSVKIGLYGREGISERMAHINIPVAKRLDEYFTISAALNFMLADLKYNNNSYSNNILAFVPKIAFENKGLRAHISVKPTLGRGDYNYILPDISLSYKLPNVLFSLFAGWDGTLQQNTFQQLTSYNPYLSSNYTIRQTHQDEIFGGITAGIGNNLGFTGKLSYRDYNDLPLFVNNISPDNSFDIIYDDVKAVSVEATLRYNIADIFSLKVGGAYYNYYQSTYARVWHEPSLRFNADFSFRPVKSLNITAYSRVLDGIYTVNNLGQETKLKAAFDVGLGGEYTIVSRLCAFLNINNLFNNKYQRWYNYEAYGFNIFGGLRLKF